MRNRLLKTADSLAARLQAIDYNKLPISDYNKQYIGNLKPALRYYMRIYADCLQKGVSAIELPTADITLIDYGGGSGFLSMLAKETGIGRVIYIDLNPNSVETIQLLKAETGIGPDVILQGGSDILTAWCKEQEVKPELLIATDLIEHVYNLPHFFSDLIEINHRMHMIFTTGSNPYNYYTFRKLVRMMEYYEKGDVAPANYLTLRKEFIAKNFPDFEEDRVEGWAMVTRGMIFEDIQYTIRRADEVFNTERIPIFNDPINTCDPRTGNWVERILPISRYRTILRPFRYRLLVYKGFYNTYRSNPFKSLVCKCLNGLLIITGKMGIFFAPYIILSCSRDRVKK